MKIAQLILMAVFAVGCSNSERAKPKIVEVTLADALAKLPDFEGGDNFHFDGLVLSKAEVRNFWLTSLSEKNPHLYMEVVRAIITSRERKHAVYVLKDTAKNGVVFYYSAADSGHGKDVMMVDFASKELRFDHFSESDGPSIWDATQKIWIDKKVKEINKEVKISDFN